MAAGGGGTKLSIADIEAKYNSPDTVVAGEEFSVVVFLAYLQNQDSHLSTVSLLWVSVNLAECVNPWTDSIVSKRYDHKARLLPGEEYSNTFVITAPKVTGTYYVILSWGTYNSPFMGNPNSAGEKTWDTSTDPPQLEVGEVTSSKVTSSNASQNDVSGADAESNALLPIFVIAAAAIVMVVVIPAAVLARGKGEPQLKPVSPAVEVMSRPPETEGTRRIETVFCFFCGEDVPPNASFCGICGRKQRWQRKKANS